MIYIAILQINRAVVDTLDGIQMGIDWLLKQCASQ